MTPSERKFFNNTSNNIQQQQQQHSSPSERDQAAMERAIRSAQMTQSIMSNGGSNANPIDLISSPINPNLNPFKPIQLTEREINIRKGFNANANIDIQSTQRTSNGINLTRPSETKHEGGLVTSLDLSNVVDHKFQQQQQQTGINFNPNEVGNSKNTNISVVSPIPPILNINESTLTPTHPIIDVKDGVATGLVKQPQGLNIQQQHKYDAMCKSIARDEQIKNGGIQSVAKNADSTTTSFQKAALPKGGNQ